MQFKIVYLADNRDFVSTCASWAFDTWGRYNPSYSLEKRIASFSQHCHRDQIPLTVVALDDQGKPVGMSSLRANDGIRDDLTPWLGSVYVAPAYRSKGLKLWWNRYSRLLITWDMRKSISSPMKSHFLTGIRLSAGKK